MLFKKVHLIFILLIISFYGSVHIGSASVRPIIVSNDQSIVHSSTNLVKLSWNIIDDNPNYYQIYQNESLLKSSTKIMSNVIDFDFNAINGNYNISLVVVDYSGYKAISSTIIIITIQSIPTSNIGSNSQTTHTYASSSASSPGYTYYMGIFTLLTAAIITNRIRNKKKKS